MKKDNGTHRIRNPGSIYESDPDHFLVVLYFSDDLDAVLFVKRKEGI